MFNESQIRAISHYLGPALVLAGPGSGKTTVITHRVKNLITQYKVSPEKILVVTVTEDVQLERLMNRNNLSKEEAEARIKSQLPLSEKEKGADAVIYNNGSLEESKRQLNSILKLWSISPYNSEK